MPFITPNWLYAVPFMLLAASSSSFAAPGQEEFGLSKKQLAQKIIQVEKRIASCMREQGFEYLAASYVTIRRGMSADKNLPGMTEGEFIQQHGFGISTFYTGLAPQLVSGYNPSSVGLGTQNISLFQQLSPADQVAYNRELLGDPQGPTFAVALENENFANTGGCTHSAIAQVFDAETLQASYYNPLDKLISNDPRMKKALARYARQMQQNGYDYNHPDEVEKDLSQRLDAITEGGTLAKTQMSRAQLQALAQLQEYERRVAIKSFELEQKLLEPVEEKIESELYARDAG